MPKGDLSGKTDENVEPAAGDCSYPRQRKDENVVFVGTINYRRRSNDQNNQQAIFEGGRGAHYTFLTEARPNSPLGEIHKTRMTSPKPRIWLLAEPKAEIIPASMNP